MPPSVAVIIPTGSPHDQLEKCLNHCAQIGYPNCVFAVVTDDPMDVSPWPRTVNIVTNSKVRTGPATKRDFAAASLPGYDIYAYLDADAYPRQDWISKAVEAFSTHPDAVAVGGPGIMPSDQTYSEALSAACTESILGAGPIRYRFWPTKPMFCDDYPAYNFFVRAEALHRAGGWASDLYSGEDTLLCEKIVEQGGKIFYDPGVIIWHYRRKLVPYHWQQNFNVGRSRGTCVREGSPSSRRAVYFAPLIGMLLLLAFFMSVILSGGRLWLLAGALVLYPIVASVAHPGPIRWQVRAALPFALAVHHAAYAYGFLLGVLFKGRRRVVPPSLGIA